MENASRTIDTNATNETMTLHNIGLKYGTDKATFHGYCPFYEQHLPAAPKRLLEIGVKDGASLRMWREFYPEAEIVGIDINPPIAIAGCTVLQMDATDTVALATLGQFDVIIDDGSHLTSHQQIAFTQLYWVQLKPGGWYVMEDVHTSFWPQYMDTEVNTYEILKECFPKLLEWSRTPDLSDSVTMMIPKL